MRKEVFGALEVAQLAHEQLDIQGSVVEIGVYHGTFFLAMDQLRRPSEAAAAFDVFASQELNIDQSGKGDLDVFKENLHQYGTAPGTVAIVQADSTTLDAGNVLEALGGQHPRLFSIDGGHTKAHVFSDLVLAEQTLCPGGIVFVDDYMHPAWPEVTEGLHLWMQSHVKLQPFAWVGRKLLMTTIAHRERLFNLFMEHKNLISAAKHKETT
ncbi:MAG: class I SAM-dependent methyltransferase, partial [Chloroflexi bacterium]|nr:class I SAM-dependent methyltransferase [Chloroflexota bacterium]